jgi:hypothetical protein
MGSPAYLLQGAVTDETKNPHAETHRIFGGRTVDGTDYHIVSASPSRMVWLAILSLERSRGRQGLFCDGRYQVMKAAGDHSVKQNGRRGLPVDHLGPAKCEAMPGQTFQRRLKSLKTLWTSEEGIRGCLRRGPSSAQAH